ncbi:MAG TPA: ECF transporter S component [Chloroflexi bacterium]|nr:ECF transporter S component [Chloroflexota bacterium]
METSVQSTTVGVRRVVISGIMVAVTVLLGMLPVGGFIPFPTGVNATTLHIPAIIGGILEGWQVGGIIGLCFGLFSFLRASTPLFKDPLVAILPRIFIGITAYLAYKGLQRFEERLAIGVAAGVGTATNTILVLGIAVWRGYLAPDLAATIAVTHGLPEIVVAVVITLAVVVAWRQIASRRGGSSVLPRSDFYPPLSFAGERYVIDHRHR